MEQVAADGQPGKVIDFIKKWVSKEKMLIAHCVRTVIIPMEVDQAIDNAAIPNTEGTEDEEAAKQHQLYLMKELASKKNKDQFEYRVKNGQSRRKNRVHAGANLNTSKESVDDFIRKTQDHFYKAAPES